MHLSELKALHVSQLLDMAVANEIEGANRLRKHELIFALLKKHDMTLAGVNQHIGSLFMEAEGYLNAAEVLLHLAERGNHTAFLDLAREFFYYWLSFPPATERHAADAG